MIPSLTVRQSDLSDLEASRASFPQQFKSISFAVWDVGCQDKVRIRPFYLDDDTFDSMLFGVANFMCDMAICNVELTQ